MRERSDLLVTDTVNIVTGMVNLGTGMGNQGTERQPATVPKAVTASEVVNG